MSADTATGKNVAPANDMASIGTSSLQRFRATSGVFPIRPGGCANPDLPCHLTSAKRWIEKDTFIARQWENGPLLQGKTLQSRMGALHLGKRRSSTPQGNGGQLAGGMNPVGRRSASNGRPARPQPAFIHVGPRIPHPSIVVEAGSRFWRSDCLPLTPLAGIRRAKSSPSDARWIDGLGSHPEHNGRSKSALQPTSTAARVSGVVRIHVPTIRAWTPL